MAKSEVAVLVVSRWINFSIFWEQQRVIVASCCLLYREVKVSQFFECHSLIWGLHAELSLRIITRRINISIDINCQRMSLSACDLCKLYRASRGNRDSHGSKCVLRSIQTSCSELSISPCKQVTIIHNDSSVSASTSDLYDLVHFISLEWINKQWSWWLNQAGIADTKLSLGISSEGKQEAIPGYESCMMVSAWNLRNDDIEG